MRQEVGKNHVSEDQESNHYYAGSVNLLAKIYQSKLDREEGEGHQHLRE